MNLQNIPSKDDRIRKMFVASPGYVLIGGDYSQQEPHILAEASGDENLKRAYDEGKDVYAEMASLAMKRPYREFLEFQTNDDGSWKLDDVGHRIENKEGHRVRSHFKAILLGIMYGKGAPAIAEDLGITKQEAQNIIDSFYSAFPKVRGFIEGTKEFARRHGYVDGLWGRRRRLPDMTLPKYDIRPVEGYVADFNPLAFGSEDRELRLDRKTRDAWWSKMDRAYGPRKREVVAEALSQGVSIVDNSMKVSDAERQCCNSVIQGTAATMSKVAMVRMFDDPVLNGLGFHILIVVHDEIIGECPEENAKAAAERMSELMVEACHERVHMKMKTDVEVTRSWTGDPVKI